jgi:hypothetical protein
MSLLQSFGLPNEIGIILFLIALGAILAPFLGGLEMGSVVIPPVPERRRTTFTLTGVVGLIFALILFYPAIKTASPKDIAGEWLLIDTVDETGDSQYLGTLHRFALVLEVDGSKISGKAEKTSYQPTTSGENPRNVSGAEKSQLRIEGKLRDNILYATFDEIGAKRSSNGQFLWHFSENFRAFKGSFSSTIARIKGRCEGVKLP